ncbi:type II toxin-antitoxin system VapC family toxin [Acidipropionibacterium virtanenii]|uniref:Ribonuclease VapC n=1 Tax=Acidipropionibacterium virtanenii TaxID=2057246 RepID=A0A344URQ4_9ACTN|nr:type II toxin-antitoxin system VapC family toxin [Acidipropionibacterium virtanenii]AXE37952.1 Ribonuclease VapC30 [Acidipropionibacterium virtanenii]
MIVDSSVLVAVLTGEPDAEHYLDLMIGADHLVVSAAGLVESSVVLEARAGAEAVTDLQALLADLEADVLPLDEDQAILASQAWSRFGKGRHLAGLNLGDLFAYAAASGLGEPLLFKGDDFAQTDIPSADH